ncbi:hypothetical protein Bbelb_048830 [Branchiostoma belcheri]|nr:hypothetical protein Bbelb_048830 [Branchiostoma belcheri]
MGSPVSPIVANLYMEKFELKAINSFPGTPPANWFRYVDDTWCRLKKGLADSFFEHINKVDKHISFTQETSQDNTLPFLDAKLHVETDGHIEVEVYRKPTHTDQYLIFDSHHPLEQKLGVIRTLFHRADTLITSAEARAKEHTHLKKALSKCGYQQWTFNKALKPSDSSKKTSRNSQLDRTKTVNISIPYIQGVSEKIRRILHNYNIATNFKPCRTLRQMLFHPKDKLKNCVKSDVIYRLKCEDHQCKETYIGETSQPLKERYKQHCRASNSGFSSAIWHHLDKHKGHSFHLESTDILDREARWFERGVKEAIYERLYKPSLNRKGGLRVELSSETSGQPTQRVYVFDEMAEKIKKHGVFKTGEQCRTKMTNLHNKLKKALKMLPKLFKGTGAPPVPVEETLLVGTDLQAKISQQAEDTPAACSGDRDASVCTAEHRSFVIHAPGRRTPQRRSESEILTCSVPQGTLLGPILFLAVFDDAVRDAAPSIHEWKYVDDLTITEARHRLERSIMQLELDKFGQWSKDNYMLLNGDKCKIMTICFLRIPPAPPSLNISVSELESVEVACLLGVWLQANLKWETNVTKMLNKANGRLFLLRRLKHFNLPVNDLLQVYKSYVRPVVEYCAPVWHPGLTSSQSARLERIQKRALRTILKDQYVDYNSALHTTDLQSLSSRRTDLCRKCASKINPDLLPPRGSEEHGRNTRNANKLRTTTRRELSTRVTAEQAAEEAEHVSGGVTYSIEAFRKTPYEKRHFTCKVDYKGALDDIGPPRLSSTPKHRVTSPEPSTDMFAGTDCVPGRRVSILFPELLQPILGEQFRFYDYSASRVARFHQIQEILDIIQQSQGGKGHPLTEPRPGLQGSVQVSACSPTQPGPRGERECWTPEVAEELPGHGPVTLYLLRLKSTRNKITATTGKTGEESEWSDDDCWCLECFKCRLMGSAVPHEGKFAVTTEDIAGIQTGGDNKIRQSSPKLGCNSVSLSSNDSSRHADMKTENSKPMRSCSDSSSNLDSCKGQDS